jgi:hypothetical protein
MAVPTKNKWHDHLVPIGMSTIQGIARFRIYIENAWRQNGYGLAFQNIIAAYPSVFSH